MAQLRPTLVLALLLALLAVREARAGATIDLLFVGIDGSPIAPTNAIDGGYYVPGTHLTMAAFMRNDVPLTIAVFSLNYDLGGDDELDVVSVFQWGGLPINKTATDFFAPIGAFSPTTATFVGSFQGATTNFGGPRLLPPAAGAFAGGYQMGTVIWEMQFGIQNDGADVISGILNFGVDFFADSAFNGINDQVLFRGATINYGVPEPATAALFGLGICGLVLLRRRSRGGR